MLTVDPEKRITVDECLKHQWITESIDDSPLAFTGRLLIQTPTSLAFTGRLIQTPTPLAFKFRRLQRSDQNLSSIRVLLKSNYVKGLVTIAS
eukprot:GHVH01015033.1.p1 GENE.GHVH01015033.1~~GHVH01015033.1.p1  ORF type:complete len:100 (-),score=9.86 GHVH01015033.1:48-323(-)